MSTELAQGSTAPRHRWTRIDRPTCSADMRTIGADVWSFHASSFTNMRIARRGRRRRSAVADIAHPRWLTRSGDATPCSTSQVKASHLDSMVDPLRDLELNVRSHVSFLETLRRVVRLDRGPASTLQVYGRPLLPSCRRAASTAPVDVHGVDKPACEQLHLVDSNVHDLHATSLRLTNVYGPQQHLGAMAWGSSRCSSVWRSPERRSNCR